MQSTCSGDVTVDQEVSHKSVPQECPTIVSHKSARQECPTRVSDKSVPQDCSIRVSDKGALLECPTRVSYKRPTGVSDKSVVSYKSVPQECATRVPRQSVLQECPTRVSYKSAQECLLGLGALGCSPVMAWGRLSVCFHAAPPHCARHPCCGQAHPKATQTQLF